MGRLGGVALACLPSAQGAILETWDRAPRRAPGMEPVTSLPLSLSKSLLKLGMLSLQGKGLEVVMNRVTYVEGDPGCR